MPFFAVPFPIIDPIAIEFGPFVVRWYALAYIFGLVLGFSYAKKLAAKTALWGATKPPTANDLDDLMVFVALGMVLGGRIIFVLFYNLPYYRENPSEIFQIWNGGMAFHGGLLGVVLAILYMARKRGFSLLGMFDIAACVAPIGLFLGRIANFINAELWGRVSDVPWAMVFPGGGELPRHPSQLYQAGLEGIALFILINLTMRKIGFARPGRLAGLFGIGYGIARIIGEVFREPDVQLGFLYGGWLTMGMLLSLPLIILGLWLFLRAKPSA